MAEIKIPIKIDGFQCVEEMSQAVLNYTYKGRTLKEWADSISKPQTNADRIRAMTDEEMVEVIVEWCPDPEISKCEDAPYKDLCKQCWLNWLKQEVKE